MKSSNPAIQAKLAELRAHYHQTLPRQLRELRALWDTATAGRGNADALRDFVRHCHSLAGSGTTFGFPAITRIAQNMETLLRPQLDVEPLPMEDLGGKLATFLDELEEAAREKPLTESSAPEPLPPPRPPDKQLIYVTSENERLRDELKSRLKQYRYDLQAMTTMDALVDAVNDTPSSVVIVDIDMPGLERIVALHDSVRISGARLPTIVVSEENSLEQRLRAVRTAAADIFFAMPVDTTQLVDAIDSLGEYQDVEPYRVLIIDDDQPLAQFIAITLEQAGMRTHVVQDLEQVLNAIESFSPEILLTDVYMPDYTGVELAAIIRQHAGYIGFPIVFVSTETNIEKQLSAMSHGADDFISKPIVTDHLIATVANRVERFRRLNSLMVRDGLTGLLNQTATRECLETEINRAQRSELPFCYAMLDIDHFKSVNDKYGHATGDFILKTLARTLSHRLRRLDCIGRYGGEEFAVVMPNTLIEDGLSVLNFICKEFAETEHEFNGQKLKCSFSAGLAQFPEFETVASIHDAADRALYAAKHKGRNCVCTERPCFSK